MRAIAHLSDLHFGRIDLAVVEGLLADLHDHPPSLIVISGDLVQRATRNQFRAARAFLDRLPVPALVVPGNHDIPAYNLVARFTNPYRHYRHFVTPDLSPFVADEEIAVLGINTSRSLILNFSHGRINHHQIAHIQAVLGGTAPHLFKILVTHHPFLPPPHAPDRDLLGRARLALPALEAAGVDLLLAGHFHKAWSADIAHHHPLLERSILMGAAATATSTRLRDEPNSYSRISIAPPLVEFQERHWDGTRFAPADHTRYRRDGSRWHLLES